MLSSECRNQVLYLSFHAAHINRPQHAANDGMGSVRRKKRLQLAKQFRQTEVEADNSTDSNTEEDFAPRTRRHRPRRVILSESESGTPIRGTADVDNVVHGKRSSVISIDSDSDHGEVASGSARTSNSDDDSNHDDDSYHDHSPSPPANKKGKSRAVQVSTSESSDNDTAPPASKKGKSRAVEVGTSKPRRRTQAQLHEAEDVDLEHFFALGPGGLLAQAQRVSQSQISVKPHSLTTELSTRWASVLRRKCCSLCGTRCLPQPSLKKPVVPQLTAQIWSGKISWVMRTTREMQSRPLYYHKREYRYMLVSISGEIVVSASSSPPPPSIKQILSHALASYQENK
jgi:hypothetical protein